VESGGGAATHGEVFRGVDWYEVGIEIVVCVCWGECEDRVGCGWV